MAERAIFLDRDNTIISDEGYLGDPAKVKLIPGAGAALSSMRRLGYRIIVASNQSGVARGLFDENAVEAVNQEMVRQLKLQDGAYIDASYYCPYHPDAKVAEYRVDHEWRKPRPGMLKAAAEDFNLDLAQCWMIGDMIRDIAAGAAVGCRTILLADPEKPLPVDKDSPSVTPNFIVRTLADAARIIVREGNSSLRDPTAAPLAMAGANTQSLPSTMIETQPAAPAAKPMATTPTGAASPSTAAPTGVVPSTAAPTIDSSVVATALADAVASAVAEHLAKIPPPQTQSNTAPAAATESHKPVLEEMLQQLRHLNRQQDLHGFSLSLLFAAVMQMLVVLFLAIAAWDALQAVGVNYNNFGSLWWYSKTTGQINALEWLAAALIIQGFVLALHLRHRNK
jgi:D-glycero-D-manno-heptose 1,7-bisphosphate phosphatase